MMGHTHSYVEIAVAAVAMALTLIATWIVTMRVLDPRRVTNFHPLRDNVLGASVAYAPLWGDPPPDLRYVRNAVEAAVGCLVLNGVWSIKEIEEARGLLIYINPTERWPDPADPSVEVAQLQSSWSRVPIVMVGSDLAGLCRVISDVIMVRKMHTVATAPLSRALSEYEKRLRHIPR